MLPVSGTSPPRKVRDASSLRAAEETAATASAMSTGFLISPSSRRGLSTARLAGRHEQRCVLGARIRAQDGGETARVDERAVALNDDDVGCFEDRGFERFGAVASEQNFEALLLQRRSERAQQKLIGVSEQDSFFLRLAHRSRRICRSRWSFRARPRIRE